jgi:transposase
MDRLVLSDAQWHRICRLIIGRPDQRGSTGRDNRMFVEVALWIVRTSLPWRDLPEARRIRLGPPLGKVEGPVQVLILRDRPWRPDA